EYHYFHHNRELQVGQYAGPRSVKNCVTARAISHVETCHVVLGRNFTTSVRERRFLDLPGNNRAKGFSNVSLKSEDEQVRVPMAIQEQLKTEKGTVSKQDVVADDAEADGEKVAQAAKAKVAEDVDHDSAAASLLWPWGQPEDFFRELFHGFGLPGEIRVVTSTPSSAAMLASARDGYQFRGYARNMLTKKILMEDTTLRVAMAMILGAQDFGRMRVLTREASLGGSSSSLQAAFARGAQASPLKPQSEVDVAEEPEDDEEGAEGQGDEESED
ncbi:unnamed protein product, partial [Symbiodinium sp. CCMP2456]